VTLEESFRRIALTLVKDTLANNVNKCTFRSCDKLSVGATCSTCSRFLCMKHMYLALRTPPAKPRVVCAACIIHEHPELLEETEGEA